MMWEHPERWWWFWLVPLMVGGWVIASGHRRRAVEQFAQPSLVPFLADSVHQHARRWKTALLTGGVSALLLAMVGPQWGFHWEEITRRGVDLVIALDVSKSMLATDVKPNRLERAKLAIQELIPLLTGDQIGLVLFAGTSFLHCPLTADYSAFLLTLDEAGPDAIPRGGTALSHAIRTGVKALERSPKTSRALILITDGEDHEGDALAAAEDAAKEGIQVFCVGIGTPEGELIPITDDQGRQEFLKDREGRAVKSRLDEETLQRVAMKTGGSYVRATATAFGLDLLYRERIAQLTPHEGEATLKKVYEPRFQWPLLFALILFMVEPWISDRQQRSTKEQPAVVHRP